MLKKRFFASWVLVLGMSFLAGCASPSAPEAGFVDSSRMAERPDLPFQKAWVRAGLDWKKYSEMYIAPVNTAHMMKSDSWKALGHYGKAQGEVQAAADYMRTSFIKAFQEDPNKRFTIVERPGESTLVLEMALTELTPNSPALKAAGMIPIYGWAAKALNATTPTEVAFEARVRDGVTGDIIATFADCRAKKKDLINTEDFTWYGYANGIIDDWSKELVELANRRPGEIVKKAAGYKLKPW